jgi:hypothetical protein
MWARCQAVIPEHVTVGGGVSAARDSSCTFFVQLLIGISRVLACLLVGTSEQFAFIAWL